MNKIIQLYHEKKLNPLIISGQFFFFSLVVLLQDFFVRLDFLFMPFFYETMLPILMLLGAISFTVSTLKNFYKIKRFSLILLQVTFTPYLITFIIWVVSGHLSTTWVLALGFYIFVLLEAATGVYDD